MTTMTDALSSSSSQDAQITVTVLGQEGDDEPVTVNPHAHCEQLLRKGLHALYGDPGPNPAEYDLVLHGTVIEPLSQTLAAAGIGDSTTVSILPKTISRGSR